MNKLLSLSFYTNIPTPYQDDFFTALNTVCNFKAIFYAAIEKDRSWKLDKVNYHRVFIKNSLLARIIQSKFKDFHFSWSIFKVAFHEEADWIILGGNYFALNNLIAAFILKLRGKKLAFYSEPVKVEGLIIKLLKKLYLSIFTFFLDLIIGVGRKAEISYRSLGVKKIPFLNIPYNINNDLFKNENLDQYILEQLRAELNLNSKFVIISSGSLIHRKGMDLVVKVVNALDIKYPNQFAGLILGTGDLLNQLQDLDKGNVVRFCGFKTKTEIPYFFKLSDVFLFCSRYDGWGLVVNEAVASELPIICSDKVGSSEWITDNGFIFSNENVESIVELVEKIYLDSSLKLTMSFKNSILKERVSSLYYANILVQALANSEK